MQDHEPRARRYLASLPEPSVPGALGDRIRHARASRMRTRAGGVAVALLGALGLVLMMPAGLAPNDDARTRVAPAPVHPVPGDDADRLRTVHAIDRALQAAYDRNADDDEIEPLWRARAALVDRAAALGRPDRG